LPLTEGARAALGTPGEPDELIFKPATGQELHDTAMRAYVKDRGCSIHGFRSTFVDWAAEHGYPSELRELALAHAVGDTVERAYHRTNRLAERRVMMQVWSDFICSPK
jgi:integrase